MRKILSAVVIGAFASAAGAQSVQEQVVKPALRGFVVGHSASTGPVSIQEEVPAGETIHNWTRMVTTQRFAGVGDRISAQQFLEMLSSRASSNCRDGQASSVGLVGKAARVRADCPSNPATGKPETFFAWATSGASDLHVVQVAFRRTPTSEDVKWAEAYLKGVRLCNESTGKTC